MKSFQVGDWRLGIKELRKNDTNPLCPFGCQTELNIPHFLFWCPVLYKSRKDTGILDFHHSHKLQFAMDDDHIVVRYLWANSDDPLVMKTHGKTLIKLRNTWYRLAQEHGVHLNVRMREIDIKVSKPW